MSGYTEVCWLISADHEQLGSIRTSPVLVFGYLSMSSGLKALEWTFSSYEYFHHNSRKNTMKPVNSDLPTSTREDKTQTPMVGLFFPRPGSWADELRNQYHVWGLWEEKKMGVHTGRVSVEEAISTACYNGRSMQIHNYKHQTVKYPGWGGIDRNRFKWKKNGKNPFWWIFDGFYRFLKTLLSDPFAHKNDKKSCYKVQKWPGENAYQFKSIFFHQKSIEIDFFSNC